jgi:hypothetical protein
MLSDAHMGWWKFSTLSRDRVDRDHDHGDAYETFTDEGGFLFWVYFLHWHDSRDGQKSRGVCDETHLECMVRGSHDDFRLVHAYSRDD